MNISNYLEKRYPFVGLHPNPPDRSSDNGLLFSATYLVLSGDGAYIEEFDDLVWMCRDESGHINGFFKRYPADTGYTAHDDFVGVLVASKLFELQWARKILSMGKETGWHFGDRFFGRIPYFRPLVYAACGRRLSIFQQLIASISYIGDCFSPREETSGRCLLYLMTKVFCDQGLIIRSVLHVWRRKMRKLYPDGPKGMYAIYFGAEHPFAVDGPTEWV